MRRKGRTSGAKAASGTLPRHSRGRREMGEVVREALEKLARGNGSTRAAPACKRSHRTRSVFVPSQLHLGPPSQDVHPARLAELPCCLRRGCLSCAAPGTQGPSYCGANLGKVLEHVSGEASGDKGRQPRSSTKPFHRCQQCEPHWLAPPASLTSNTWFPNPALRPLRRKKKKSYTCCARVALASPPPPTSFPRRFASSPRAEGPAVQAYP